MTVLINGRDEPRVMFDVGLLFEDTFAHALTLTDPTPFALSPPRTGAFFAQPERRDVCRPAGDVGVGGDVPCELFLFSVLYGRWDGTGRVPPSSCFARVSAASAAFQSGVSVLVSASSAEFTTDLVPVHSMTKLADASVSGGARGVSGAEGAGSCFMDVLVPEEIFSWNNIDDCDADAIRNAYNITGESVPREEAYQYKYLLDINGNTFLGRLCARMKCRHRCAEVRIGAASLREQREGRSEGLVVGGSSLLRPHRRPANPGSPRAILRAPHVPRRERATAAHGSAHDEHPHPGAPPWGRPPPIYGPDSPSSHSSPSSDSNSSGDDMDTEAHLPSSQPLTLPAARTRYTLKTARPPPMGAQERGCLVDGYAGVWRDFAPFWRVEMAVAAQREKDGVGKSGGRLEGKGGREWFRERVEAVEKRTITHGIAALTIRDSRAHEPEHQATSFDGDWEGMVNKFASALPPMTVLINGRDEPRVVFDVGPLFEDPTTLAQALTLTDPTPFALSPPRTDAFFAQPERKDVCCPARGVGGVGEVPSEFTTDLVRMLNMTKLADASTSLSGGDSAPGGQLLCGCVGAGVDRGCMACIVHPCCAAALIARLLALPRARYRGPCVCVWGDVDVEGSFYYRNSWWAGKCEYPDDVKWEDKMVLYWRGKSNGGHIRGTNYRAFQ
ncbi:hypothetical protein B0H13DRAFT_2505547 [Mycena leptocephala]|nr:hypothetical protein B0H13DRAFT_2505547 [Mycena leptocephala]